MCSFRWARVLVLGGLLACSRAGDDPGGSADADPCQPGPPPPCDDGDACTIDTLVGDPCAPVCESVNLTECAYGDGCCPAGCASANDGDCAAVCGNDAVEVGETCDPPASCPAACDDLDACTTDTLTGTAAACNASCTWVDLAACAAGDACCPPGCDPSSDADCPPFAVDPAFADQYRVFDLGPAPGVPTQYGCIMVDPVDVGWLLLGGAANTASGLLYRVPVTRNPAGHITGFGGDPIVYAAAEYNDGGIARGPGDVLFLARWPVNAIGQLAPGSTTTGQVTDLAALGVASSPGGLAFVPAGFPGAGTLKIVSWPSGQWYEVTLIPDGAGLFALTAAAPRGVVGGGPEGMAFAPLGSPLIPEPSVIVSEWSIGEVALYELDAAGDPIVATRRRLIVGLAGAEGAAIDPVTGDFLFSTFGGGNRVVVVRGFVPPIP
jgi:hypothetical protein